MKISLKVQLSLTNFFENTLVYLCIYVCVYMYVCVYVCVVYIQWSRNEFHVGGGGGGDHFHIPSSVQFQCKQSMQEVFPSP